jgi:predicted N-acetyltransferase YhbS
MENKNSIPEITTMIDDILIVEYDETKVKPGEEANLIKDLKEKLNCNVVLVQSHVKIVGKIRCYPTPKTHQDMASFKARTVTPAVATPGAVPVHQ